jgi:aspartate aminotransferase-like enzyme
MNDVQFKQAETAEEIEQIHRLNHRIFAEEVGQHAPTPDGRLVDKFHARNCYFVAKCRGEIVGMVSAHGGPEFSIASRLKDIGLLKTMRAPLEIRLLAILPELRSQSILAGLFWQVRNYARENRHSDLLISGIVERLSMYEKLGFRAMGPAVRCGHAEFVPMRLSLDAENDCFLTKESLYGGHWRRRHAVSLLPGPVAIPDRVSEAFHREPMSHRSRQFIDLYQELRLRLSGVTGGLETAVLCGSGTLANDAVAANLRSAMGDREGLIIANGEFGERLIRQATMAGLQFQSIKFGWCTAWDFRKIESALERQPAWVWAVHLETSTGVLNDLGRLTHIAQQYGAVVAADCVSSLGAVELRGFGPQLFLASGVSGKALGSYAGLAFVFLSARAAGLLRGAEICPTFDVVGSAESIGPVTTLPSPIVIAALEALRASYDGDAARSSRYRLYEDLGRWARMRIRESGLEILADEADAAPTITTFPLPSGKFARECLQAGFRIAHESNYLQKRRWGQIATMGDLDRAALEPLFAHMQVQELTPPGK